MTPRQAAKIIGVSPQHVRTLIRKGVIEAREVEDRNGQCVWEVTKVQAEKARDNRPKKTGRPKGAK